MTRLLTALAVAGAALVAPTASADPVPFPYCAYDPTGNAGQWFDPCLRVGPQPGVSIGGNPGIGTYNQPDMPWDTRTNPDTGDTVNPFAPGGSMW
ncbi:hypothetical protein C5U48_05710 [Mycolicibacter virginiensis]|uniref:Uncharacterized protein n=1 Tax=Mycolicibacter virginiensis TaxID=1795032 RepID=A0A9X7NZJ0_9MYCO|nr:hypothetical protein [Mycolicibacter virginiensis]PQM53125.1 hypothetical protein C5U48_05710 [Mycolicibacter virginiensis]